MKKAIKIEELQKFTLTPYNGEGYAPESKEIKNFLALMAEKGYTKSELTEAWDKVREKKLEAHERGSKEKFTDDPATRPLIVNEMSLEAAICYIFRQLLVTDMKSYYCAWLEAVDRLD